MDDLLTVIDQPDKEIPVDRSLGAGQVTGLPVLDQLDGEISSSKKRFIRSQTSDRTDIPPRKFRVNFLVIKGNPEVMKQYPANVKDHLELSERYER